MKTDTRHIHAKRAPISGTPGARPLGSGIGAVASLATSAAPVGTLVGATGGNRIARDSSVDDHGLAYSFGEIARSWYPGRDFDEVERELSAAWIDGRGASTLSWERAKQSARDAWNHSSPSRLSGP